MKTELVEQITKTYQDRCALFGKQKERICSSIEELKGDEKLYAMAIYAMLPLSDIADYEFELLKSYAVHGAFLYQNAAFYISITYIYIRIIFRFTSSKINQTAKLFLFSLMNISRIIKKFILEFIN